MNVQIGFALSAIGFGKVDPIALNHTSVSQS